MYKKESRVSLGTPRHRVTPRLRRASLSPQSYKLFFNLQIYDTKIQLQDVNAGRRIFYCVTLFENHTQSQIEKVFQNKTYKH